MSPRWEAATARSITAAHLPQRVTTAAATGITSLTRREVPSITSTREVTVGMASVVHMIVQARMWVVQAGMRVVVTIAPQEVLVAESSPNKICVSE